MTIKLGLPKALQAALLRAVARERRSGFGNEISLATLVARAAYRIGIARGRELERKDAGRRRAPAPPASSAHAPAPSSIDTEMGCVERAVEPRRVAT